MKKSVLISLEGISGCGKTYLMNYLKSKTSFDKLFHIKEISDRDIENVDKKILSIIQSDENSFFNTGIPYTETLLLLALKTHDYEAIIKEKLAEGYIVFEDRSIDTVAVYQSIIIHNSINDAALALAKRIFTVASMHRKIPDLTFLIKDDFHVSINRAESRNKKKYSTSEIQLLKNANDMYPLYFESLENKNRVHILDRKIKDIDACVSTIESEINTWLQQ